MVKWKALKCKPSALNASLYARPCVIDGASNTSRNRVVALVVWAIPQVFQRLSYLLYSILCFNTLARCFINGKARPQPQTVRHLNYYATLRTYLVKRVYHWKNKENRDQNIQKPVPTWRRACSGDMTRARFYSLPERARARSTARWLFSLVFTPYLWNAVVSGKSPR